jgi:hypothetical protein
MLAKVSMLTIMSALEIIVEELKALPPGKLAAAADYIHQLKETSLAERRHALDRAFGCLTEEEGRAMEAAIQANCERIDASQW